MAQTSSTKELNSNEYVPKGNSRAVIVVPGIFKYIQNKGYKCYPAIRIVLPKNADKRNLELFKIGTHGKKSDQVDA